MKYNYLKISLLGMFLLGSIQLQAAAPALKVLSASPKGQQQNMGRQAVNVHFNQPVVSLSEASQFAGDNCPISITPRIEGTCRFSGTQTVLFEPTEKWPDATKFTVTVPKGFTSKISKQKLGNAYSFSFSTQVPQVTLVYPYANEHWISLTPTIYVATTLPINLTKAAAFISISAPAQASVPVSVRKLTEAEIEKSFSYMSSEEKQNLFAINPTQPLLPDQHYTLTLQAGLPAKTGTLGLHKDYTSSFFTYPSLRVQQVLSTGCLPFTPEIRLSSPVRKKEIYNAITTVPADAKLPLPEAEKDSLGYEYTNSKTQEAYFRMPLSFIKVQPHQPVEVTLHKGVRDIYGNTLEQGKTFTVANDGYCPAVDFSATGIGVLESYLPVRLPISVMNIPSLFIESARFNRDNFIPFYEQNTSYCARKPLKGETFAGSYTFPSIKDKTLRTFIDLARFKPTAKDSIIFSQFKQQRRVDDEECWVSATDNITDIGVSFKTSSQNILLWTTSLKTGQPLAGLAVELRSKENKVVWTGTTNEQGLALAPGWGKLDVPTTRWGQPTLYAFITSPQGDAVVSNLWNDGLEPWRFNMDYEFNPTAQTLQTYLFAQRGVYRPGETVNIKGVVRQQENGNWKLPSVVRGTLTVQDARGEQAFKQDVTVSAQWGTFDTYFVLPQTAATGYWDVSFDPQVKGENVDSAYTSFQVESVKPADFNVFVKPNMTEYLGGEEATFSAAAQYYFGAPLGGAKAQWSLRQESTWFTPKGYEKYTFTPYFLQRELMEENGKLLLKSSGMLDSKGSLLFAAKMPHVQIPTRVYAEVDIASPAHQNLFKRTSVLVHPADIYIGAKIEKEQPQQGQPLEVKVVAVTPDGKPAQTTANVTIYREQYYSVRKVGLSGRLEWVSEKQVTPLPSQQIVIGKKGGSFTFLPEEAGSYYIKLASKDLFGRPVQGGIDVYVYGQSNTYGPKSDDDLLNLTQNKNEYKVGQTARIRVQSPYEIAQALVTVEREGILDAWTTTIVGGQADIKIPIKDTYLPNVYVGVMMVQGRSAKPSDYKQDLGKPQVKIGYVNLNVIPDSKRLVTTIKPDASKYQPGDTVTLSLTTKVGGKATPAEVVVMAVDEGILALTNYQTPDLFKFFYGEKPISVFTMDNRTYVIGQRSFGEKGENRGGGGAAASKLAGTDLRSRFSFAPYYQAAVHTDAKGRAKVSFVLPDNLTTFRLMAVSLTKDEFGKAENKITVSKPVMITPNMPRFARVGDVFDCGAIVYNYEDTKGQFQVQINSVGGIRVQGNNQQRVSVPKGQSREVTWKCQADTLGEANVAMVATGRYSDGVQTQLTVSTPEKEQTLAVYGATESSQKQVLEQPAGLHALADNRVKVTLASTALLQLKGAMNYLLTYPYNCLEQQLSKIVPAISASALVESFQLASKDSLHKQAQEVLNALPTYQHVSGGYGYWPDSLPDRFITAYALDIALQAKQAGYDVPTSSIDKAINWLEGAFAPKAVYAYDYSTQEVETAQAYSIYVLTRYGKKMDSAFNTLYAKRGSLPQQAVAYLLQAANAMGRGQNIQQTLAEQLTSKLVYTPTSAYIDAGSELPWLHGNTVSVTASTLKALLMTKQPLDVDFQLVSWLLTQLNAQGYWQNTHTSATVLQALQAYYNVRESTVPSFVATVKNNGQDFMNASFQGRSLHEQTQAKPFAYVYSNGNKSTFEFAKQGSGTLYYTLGQYYTPASYTKPVNAGFTLTRSISTLDGKPVQEILTGERYKVTVIIDSAATRSFVVVEDFIPAGFSLVNTSLATESATQADLINADNNAFNRVEQYQDRIYGFADNLSAGKHTFSYLVTATTAGTYTYPAAWASQMYDPAVFGRNTTTSLVIK